MLSNALLNKVPRPEFHQAFAHYGVGLVNEWINTRVKVLPQKEWEVFMASLPQPGDPRQLIHLLESVAYGADKPDAFKFGENLKVVLNWPVDGALIGIFISVIELVQRKYLRTLTSEWVMKTGVRFDKKPGDTAIIYDKTANLTRSGTVKSVDRPIAAGVVNCGGKDVFVYAEQVTS